MSSLSKRSFVLTFLLHNAIELPEISKYRLLMIVNLYKICSNFNISIQILYFFDKYIRYTYDHF